MTNWETFQVIALTMGLLLAPFVAIVVAGLRSSKDTYEVVYKAQSFKNPWLQYFISLDIFIATLAVFTGGFLAKTLTIQGNFSFIPFVLVLTMFASAGYVFALTINHWKYTKDVIITFNPTNRTIFIEDSFCKYELGDGDIESAELFGNERRVSFFYYKLKIRDMPDLILTGNTRGVLGIFEFFKKIPVQYHRLYFPIIR